MECMSGFAAPVWAKRVFTTAHLLHCVRLWRVNSYSILMYLRGFHSPEMDTHWNISQSHFAPSYTVILAIGLIGYFYLPQPLTSSSDRCSVAVPLQRQVRWLQNSKCKAHIFPTSLIFTPSSKPFPPKTDLGLPTTLIGAKIKKYCSMLYNSNVLCVFWPINSMISNTVSAQGDGYRVGKFAVSKGNRRLGEGGICCISPFI